MWLTARLKVLQILWPAIRIGDLQIPFESYEAAYRRRPLHRAALECCSCVLFGLYVKANTTGQELAPKRTATDSEYMLVFFAARNLTIRELPCEAKARHGV